MDATLSSELPLSGEPVVLRPKGPVDGGSRYIGLTVCRTCLPTVGRVIGEIGKPEIVIIGRLRDPVFGFFA